MDQTLPYSPPNLSGKYLCLPFTIMLGFGTGDLLSQEVYRRLEEGNRFHYGSADNGKEQKKSGYIVDVAEDIAFIQSALRSSMGDLAHCIGVSRQAIYNWKAGGNIKPEHFAKVAQLKAAADVLVSEGVPGSARVLKRKLPGGDTLFEAIDRGVDGRSAAMSLVSLLRHEVEQQSALNKRLAARLASAPKHSEYGAPAFDEKAKS